MPKHLQVIKWIDKHPRSEPFALYEIMKDVGGGRNHVYTILKRLRILKFLQKTLKGPHYKVWWISHKWIDVKIVIKDYDLYILTRLSVRDLDE